MDIKPVKTYKKAVIGLYTVGLNAYWAQFEGLKERLTGYGNHIAGRLGEKAVVRNFGLVDSIEKAREAGAYFNKEGVDLVFCHAATYVTSSCVVPVHQISQAPVVVLNLQPTAQVDYDKMTTGEWLANCNACVVPEISNAFHRSGIRFDVVNGLLGMDRSPNDALSDEKTDTRPEAVLAWQDIDAWVDAAKVIRNLKTSRFGFLGNVYSGMLDLYTDITRVQARTKAHVDLLEMCDLDAYLKNVTRNDIDAKLAEIGSMFEISDDDASDPIAQRPTEEQLAWAATVAAAQEKMVRDLDLDGLAYYYHGGDGNAYERLQSGFIAGHSLLTAKGVPCAGEGDLKTLVAMKIGDILGIGGSFCEIVTTDYVNGTILLGHDGPFHLDIAQGKPVLRGMKVYHGKKGSGVSVEAKVKKGPVTTLNITETRDGQYRMIVAEGMSTDGPIMKIGNTQTQVMFRHTPDIHMARWFSAHPTHHFAMTIGHNADVLKKVAILSGWDYVLL